MTIDILMKTLFVQFVGCGSVRDGIHLRTILDYEELNLSRDNLMKESYDFSKGERGKFYNPTAEFELPIYLDADILTLFSTHDLTIGQGFTTITHTNQYSDCNN